MSATTIKVDRELRDLLKRQATEELERDSLAMTEQVRTIARQRVVGRTGQVDTGTLGKSRGVVGFRGRGSG
ncbi:hypothetical protein [Rhodococcus sp. IEGM 1408]|uniref:hypothetical protein n=1 Tax=Rhodococcus sp. IEGM 1408 TaxID=3082220 RepID=UPI0029530C10|nr:hypothetical protein [Rhodococcus sp. IEGM 1408]MDV8003064.1 hypothetical protein [Rhodococcus sp. IEGM 1408]